MKKAWTLFIALIVLLSLAACTSGKNPPTTEPTEPPHTHSYTETVTAPTCTEKGYTTYACDCGESYTGNEVPANGHSYTETVTDPTCTEKGYTTYSCDCGDTYTGKTTAALGRVGNYQKAHRRGRGRS